MSIFNDNTVNLVLKIIVNDVVDLSSGAHCVDGDEASSDCEIVECKLPTAELVQLAVKYQLPQTFFNYLDMPDCPGCIGCRSDKYVFKDIPPGK